MCLSGMIVAGSLAGAQSIRTPDGNMPMVHWAVVESTPGDMMAMAAVGGKTVAPQTAKEAGTYALYGGIDVTNPDVMRLLEIYESYEAYRIHTTSLPFQDYRAARLPMLKNLKIMEANGIALEQKDNGVATIVLMHRYEVLPTKLFEYQKLATAEAVRAVKADNGVMGVFVTGEHDNPNIIHVMELYRDKAGMEAYLSSPAAREFVEKTTPMFINSHTIENLETRITLSTKGFHAGQQR